MILTLGPLCAIRRSSHAIDRLRERTVRIFALGQDGTPSDLSETDNQTFRHNDETHLTRAWKRLVSTVNIQTATYFGVSILPYRRSRSAKSNCPISTARKWQQPGFRCSGGVMYQIYFTRVSYSIFSFYLTFTTKSEYFLE